MNRFAGKGSFLQCIALLAFFWTSLSWAELSATVDRREIALGETLRLTLLGDAGEQPNEIDLTPLNRDWEILSRSSATNARFINGQNQVTRTLEMELAPLREGTLSIPSLSAGGRSTTPLSIRVDPEPVIAPGDALVLFEASVDQASVYVQAELLLTITLQQAINLDGGEISAFDVADAVLEPLERRSFQRRVGNRTWLVTELRYAVYPQKSGPLIIPAIGFTAREVQPGRSLLGARLGRRLRLASEPLEVTVNSVPASFPGDVWLPARNLVLDETWSLEPDALNIGDSTTRTLTLIADGLQGSQLPPLSSVQGTVDIPELRFYPDQESIDQTELDRGLQGQRIQSEALVARAGGSWTLPEIRVPWWNTETDRLEYAVLPARPVNVKAVASLDITAPTGNLSSDTTDLAGSAPPWLWWVAGAGWATALLLGSLLWSSRRGYRSTQPSAGPAVDSDSVRQVLVKIRRAISAQETHELRRALLHWATLHHGKTFSSLSALAKHSSPELSMLLSDIDRSLYGTGSPAVAGDTLLEALRQEPSPAADRSRTQATLALYPAT